MKIVTLTEEEFDKYASKHKYRNYYQSSSYANTIKNFGFNIHYLGITDDSDSLIGASLIIFKEIFMGNKIAYAPRGILFDYNDSSKLEELVEKLKQILGKQGFVLLRIDPIIPSTIRDSKGNIININTEANIIITNLKRCSFIRRENNLSLEGEKPSFEAITLFNKPILDIFNNFDKRTRHKIKKATNTGIEIFIDEDKNINKLYEFIKNKHDKPIEFYENLIKNFNSNIDIYYSVLNTEKFVISSKKLYEREMDINDELARKIQDSVSKGTDKRTIINKKMESDKLINTYKNDLVLATKLLKEYPKGLIVGGAIVITYDNAAYLVIEGFDTKYKALNPNYLLKWKMINDYHNKSYKYLNLNAVVGVFEENNKYAGLNEMKLGFGSVITEYIGEFDIILNNFGYNISKRAIKDKIDT